MNLGVLASHEGTTLQSLFDAFAGGRIPGRVSVVVSNNGDSGALVKAREAGVQAVHLSSRTHGDPATLDAAIRDVLVAAAVDVVFLAGYMKKLGPLRTRIIPGKNPQHSSGTLAEIRWAWDVRGSCVRGGA
jgi:phosphoribosylglycinamide formyltransferase-1